MSDSTKYSSKLTGRKVLVIGGSSGIGFSAAEASIENGALVIISSSSQSKIDAAISRLLKSYPSAKDRLSGITCNLGDAATLEQNVIDLLDKIGEVDHIIHSAGDPLVITPLSEITVDKAIQSSMVRYYAPLMLGKHASKHLTVGPHSSITLTTGAITERPLPNWILPAGTMWAVTGLMKGLALDLAPIRVNVVCPGAVETELWNSMSKEDFEQFKKHTEETNPTERLANPEDVAEAYLYLMKDPNVTGAVIHTNGGAMLK